MIKVFVTGASGFVGRRLTNAVNTKNTSLRVLSRSKQPGIETVVCDLQSRDIPDDVLMGIDTVFHLAGIKGSPQTAKNNPSRYFVPMLQFNTNMMEAAREEGVEWYLYTSSVGVYEQSEVLVEDDVWKTFPSENDTFPAWAKRMGELQARAYEIEYSWKNYSIVRPANVYGPYDNFGEHSMVIPSLICLWFIRHKLKLGAK